MSNSSLLPVASYNLALQPFEPVPAIEDDTPVTIRLTLAALDPEAIDESAEPSTLRILKRSIIAEEDNELIGGSSDEEDELDDAEEKVSPAKDAEEKDDDKDEDEDDEDEDEGLDDDVDEFVICTLGPKIQYQQTLDLTLTPDEEVFFVVTGSYPIHLTGNYVEHPYDEDSDEESDEDFDSEDGEELDGEESDEYNLTPDEDEVMDPEEVYALLAAQKQQKEPKIQEVEEKSDKSDSKKKEKKEKKSKKREAEEPVEAPTKEKKPKNDKSVEFNKNLVQGPGAAYQDKEEKPSKKIPKKTLEGGIVIEDRTKGDGPGCKAGMRVGMRYIGKLKNGKVFDKNTSGKPFVFALGKGEVIKGWDVGVKGMAVGGERRIIIPAPMAYGKQKLPGIPANSELTFDVKLVSMK